MGGPRGGVAARGNGGVMVEGVSETTDGEQGGMKLKASETG